MKLTNTISKVLSSAVENGLRLLKIELYPGYTLGKTRMFFPPGISATPIKNEQGLMMPSGTDGQIAFLGTLTKEVVEEGEIKIYSRDEDGNVKANMYFKKDGNVDLVSDGGKFALDNESEKFKTILNDLVKEIKDIVTIGSPSSHTITIATKTKFDTLNNRINNLFKEA